MNKEKYDFLIVGAGFFGCICAYELNKAGYKVCVIEKRNHIGGNCYTEKRDGIDMHMYGAHIFHTSDEKIWKWINQFTKFNSYEHNVVANYKGKIYPLPFNMWTFNKLWGVVTPEEAKNKINSQIKNITNEPANLEEQALKLLGKDLYIKLVKGYTEKQWRKPAKKLPKEIIKRLPLRFTYKNNYFNDKYQGIPINGYTEIFNKLLKGIRVILNTDYFSSNLPEYKNLIYTGPVDKFFNYKHGILEYKTVSFKHKKLKCDNYQGCAVMNFTDKNVKYTRIIEHKHFTSTESNCTWISYEYPIQYLVNSSEPYYPVNDFHNNDIYNRYKRELKKLSNVYFGGRLAEYKYYDMHQVIKSALNFVKKIKTKQNKICQN